MLEDFKISFRLKNAYKKNSIIFSLKSLPLIKKLLPDSLYDSSGLNKFANIISTILEFFSVFAGKAIYFIAVWSMTKSMQANRADSFTHMLIFLTVIGGIMNTQIFNPTKDKFYAMFIMRMDTVKFTLTNYLYFMLKMFIGTAVFSFVFGLINGANPVTCILIPIYVICVKLCFTALTLKDCKKQRKALNENKLNPVLWVIVGIMLILSAIPFSGYSLKETVLWIITPVVIIPAVFSARYIIHFDEYRPIYKELLKPENFSISSGATGASQQLALQKKMTSDIFQTSNKSGYKYFNELFMKRHSRLLTKSAKRITLICAAILALAVIALMIFPESHSEINEILMNYLPYFLFIMYMLNRGKVITQAMFMNCDHSMLTYRFYRQPKAILSLFTQRLKYIILINLMPAVVIAAGLPLLLYITGGTDNPLNYVVLFVSIIAMSVFFSVHNIVMYYLLQPYNVNLESKSAAFGIVNWITYMLSYLCIQVKLPTFAFGTAISAFCIIYAIAAFILAYRLAPKTFKLRT